MRTKRKTVRILTAALAVLHLAAQTWATAQLIEPEDPEKLVQINYIDTPVDMVLEQYAAMTGRTLLQAPNIKAQITLTSNGRLTHRDAMIAIEAMLAMHNIALVPMGEKFLKVVQIGNVRQEGMPISMEVPEEGFSETDQLVSQLIHLQYVDLEEVKTIVQSLLHGWGKIQSFERTNSLLITGTASNIKRIMEILTLLDQPVENRIETRIYEIKYADASEVASKLNDLVQQSQEEQEGKPKPQVQVQGPQLKTPPGVIRARKAETKPEVAQIAAQMEMAERGIILGTVKIVSDERTNIIFVLSRPENFIFFDKIVSVLDRPVEPEISVQVVNLEYADAEEIAGILNSFIGAASEQEETGGVASAADDTGERGSTARAINDYVREQAAQREKLSDDSKSALGRLSSSTKILSDQRTNSLLLMGRKGDLIALQDIIDELDVMLAQVLIEAVIVEVTLGDNTSRGIDWLQRSMTVYNESQAGPAGGIDLRQPVASYGGGFGRGENDNFNVNGLPLLSSETLSLGPGALTYYLTLFDLNIDAIIRIAAQSSESRVLATPVILTTDNTEAQIVSGEERPIVTSTTTSSDTAAQTSQYEYKNIGIQLDVTPRINPQRFVVMEIKQTADNVGDIVQIDDNDVPVITKREMSAFVGVGDRQTIVLGGLVQTGDRKSRTKIPILGDLPVLGNLFRTDTRDQNKTELLVFITPYVLMTPEEAKRETRRLKDSMSLKKKNWSASWSDSDLFRALTNEPNNVVTNGNKSFRFSAWKNPNEEDSILRMETNAPADENAEEPVLIPRREEPDLTAEPETKLDLSELLEDIETMDELEASEATGEPASEPEPAPAKPSPAMPMMP